MATSISKQTHYPVYESGNQIFYQDGKILLQEKKSKFAQNIGISHYYSTSDRR